MQPGQRFEPGQAKDDAPQDSTDPSTNNNDNQTNNNSPVTPPAQDITPPPPPSSSPATPAEDTTPAAGSPPESAPADLPTVTPPPTPEAEQSSDDQNRGDTTPPPVAPTGGGSAAAEPQSPSDAVAAPDPQENTGPEAPPDSNDPNEPKDEPGNPAQFNWQASEYIEHHHSPLWYGALALISAALVGSAILIFHEFLSAIVVVLMAASIVVYAHRKPHTLDYQVDQSGITIGPKLYPYTEFKSFSVLPTQSLVTVELDPVKRFMPRLSIILGQQQAEMATNILSKHLPHEDRQPEFIDRLAHSLKF